MNEHSDFKSAAGQVTTDIKRIPVQAPMLTNASSSSGQKEQRQTQRRYRMEKDVIANDGVITAGNTASVDDWSRSYLTLSFRLRGSVVELHLTRSRTQSSRGKVFIAERGRVSRWIPTSLKDVSRVVLT